jgi:hypothetical protein
VGAARALTGGNVEAGRRWILVVVLAGAALGGAAADSWYRSQGSVPAAAQSADVATLRADVERLKSLLPNQSHIMMDVGYHWANLWFAAREQNWPLARFMFSEAKQHVSWTVLLRPVRKMPDGSEVNIKGIWDGIEPSSFAAVDIAIEQEDFAQFEKDYRVALETCYSCHKSAGLPQIRPQIPTAPPATILNFDPKATWP